MLIRFDGAEGTEVVADTNETYTSNMESLRGLHFTVGRVEDDGTEGSTEVHDAERENTGPALSSHDTDTEAPGETARVEGSGNSTGDEEHDPADNGIIYAFGFAMDIRR